MNEFMDSIPDLVNQFIETVQINNLVSSDISSRQGNLMYELDGLISKYLDHNELSSDEFINLEQKVLNAIAEDLIESYDVKLTHDCDSNGNFNPESVINALDPIITNSTVELDDNSHFIDFNI